MRKKVQAKNEEKYLELIGYLEKHRDEIIDYQLRKKAGKMIGSGLIEKAAIKPLDTVRRKRHELA
ncbi:MAG: hypothetical protein IPL59_11760 [Candidatus Competibacteraceae bacterium]|nr:hypothetical protein [Candidatus Competibacteraceae bacterium]